MSKNNLTAAEARAEEPTYVYLLAFGIAASLAGLAVTYAVLSSYGVGGGWAEAFRGASGYRMAAEQWIETGLLDNARPPAYPAFLALIAAAWGVSSYIPVAVTLQALTAWGTVMALFLVTRRTTGSAAWGLLAVALLSLNLLWVKEAIVQRETFLFSAVLMALVSVIIYVPPKSIGCAVATGALCAIGWLTRPTGVVLLPAVLLCLWRDWQRSSAPISARFTIALALSFGLPVLGWAAYQNAYHESVAISGGATALNLLKGNNHALIKIYPFIDVDRLSPVLLRPLRQAAVSQGLDWRREYYRQAIQFVRESPGEALALVPRKLAAFFLPIMFPLGSGTARLTAAGEWQVDDYEPRAIRGDGIMALPGVLAFFAALRRRRTLTGSGLLIVLAVGFTAVVHVVTFAETRFRLPYDPLLALLFAQVVSPVLPLRLGRRSS